MRGPDNIPRIWPLWIVIDTTEAAVSRSAFTVSSLAQWLGEGSLRAWDGHDPSYIRIILAGRDPPSPGSPIDIGERLREFGTPVAEPLFLEDLSTADSVAMLKDHGVKFALAETAGRALPGIPLYLRLAAEILIGESNALREIAAAHARGQIDGLSSGRYLTERIIGHIPDGSARPYLLAAMILPKLTRGLLADVVIPIVNTPPPPSTTWVARLLRMVRRPAPSEAALPEPTPLEVVRIFEALGQNAWLGECSPDGKSLTFNAGLRSLVLRLMEADPSRRRLRDTVRVAAIGYHSARRGGDDAAFALYHRLLRGERPTLTPSTQARVAPVLKPFLDDLPGDARDLLQREDLAVARRSGSRRASAKTLAARDQAGGGYSDVEWRAYLEGVAGKDGEGAKLVSRGRAEEALQLYRNRPTRPTGRPPTFVIQALADSGAWQTRDVNAARVLTELERELIASKRISSALISRGYWLTRLCLLRTPHTLSGRHRKFLTMLCRKISPHRASALAGLIAMAEALSPGDGPIAPRSWLEAKGVMESETRLRLARILHFEGTPDWSPHLDAVAVTQMDWLARARQVGAAGHGGMIAGQTITLTAALRVLRGLQGKPYAEVSKVMRSLRSPVRVRGDEVRYEAAILLLRGLTTELHRPIAQALISNLTLPARSKEEPSPFQGLATRVIGRMSIKPAEFQLGHFLGVALIDPAVWIPALVAYCDRCRLLPDLIEALAEIENPEDRELLARVTETFRAWDRALSGPGGSSWPTRGVRWDDEAAREKPRRDRA